MTSALLFAAFIINAHTFFPSISSPRAITKTNDAASQIAEYLSLHYCDSDSSKFLAEKCHLSESQLRRRFICAYGLPPIAYRNQLRCQIAAELLKRTSMTVLDISGRIGFNATSDFYRAFKKAYGTSPSGYRSLALWLNAIWKINILRRISKHILNNDIYTAKQQNKRQYLDTGVGILLFIKKVHKMTRQI